MRRFFRKISRKEKTDDEEEEEEEETTEEEEPVDPLSPEPPKPPPPLSFTGLMQEVDAEVGSLNGDEMPLFFNKTCRDVLAGVGNPYTGCVIFDKIDPSKIWGTAGRCVDLIASQKSLVKAVQTVATSFQCPEGRYILIQNYVDTNSGTVRVRWNPRYHHLFPKNEQKEILTACLLHRRGLFGELPRDVLLHCICPHLASTVYVSRKEINKSFFMYKKRDHEGGPTTILILTTLKMFICLRADNWMLQKSELSGINQFHFYADFLIGEGY